MKIEDAKVGQWVALIPSHADGDVNHENVFIGHIVSAGSLFIFVKFFGRYSIPCNAGDLHEVVVTKKE